MIGATGTIGKAVADELKEFEVLRVGHSKGEYQVDIEDRNSIKKLFETVGCVDAIISTTGLIAFGPIEELSYEQFETTVKSKILGHINLFQIGHHYLNEKGSITFTSGYLAQNPMPGSSAVSLANAALDAFVKAVALEMGEKIKINTVSPRFVKETMELMNIDSTDGISAANTAKAYRYALLNEVSGKSLDVADYL